MKRNYVKKKELRVKNKARKGKEKIHKDKLQGAYDLHGFSIFFWF